jgi:hypothetical protein
MPNHGLCGRPLDLFENDPARVWHLTVGTGEQRKDIVGLFNWDDKKVIKLRIELDKLGLPAGEKDFYFAYFYWTGTYLMFKGPMPVDIEPSSCHIIAIRRVLERPVLVSTSRHITQGIVDLTEEEWDERAKILSGKSKVVGEDPYKIRICAPTREWQAVRVKVSEDDRRAGVTASIKQEGKKILVTIKSPENREISWEVAFERQ